MRWKAARGRDCFTSGSTDLLLLETACKFAKLECVSERLLKSTWEPALGIVTVHRSLRYLDRSNVVVALAGEQLELDVELRSKGSKGFSTSNCVATWNKVIVEISYSNPWVRGTTRGATTLKIAHEPIDYASIGIELIEHELAFLDTRDMCGVRNLCAGREVC